MKRILSIVIVAILTLSMSAMAEVKTELTIMPVLISEEVKAYEIDHDGSDVFTIIVEENGSTGYTWNYLIKKTDIVEFVSEEIIAPVEAMPGAPSTKRMTFKVLKDGVTSIQFDNARAFGDEDVAESFAILAYQNGETIIIEEDGVVTTQGTTDEVGVPTLYNEDAVPTLYDNAVPTLYTVTETATYAGEVINADVAVQVVDGITMVPLRATLEAMGYTVTWNNETRSVEIGQGAQWTSISIGKNAYFRNKMVPHELSSAPVIVNDRTLVPVEFFVDIIGKGLTVDSGQIQFVDFASPIHTGYIKEIRRDESGTTSLTLTTDMASDDISIQTIIHTSDAYTFYQKDVKEGDLVNAVSSMVMTMSIPGQTSAYVIY